MLVGVSRGASGEQAKAKPAAEKNSDTTVAQRTTLPLLYLYLLLIIGMPRFELGPYEPES